MTAMADAIIVNSEAVKRGLADAGVPAGRVRVVYNGAELERFQDAAPLPWRERFGWSSGAVVVGYAGQFAPNKGVWDFMRAAQSVLDRDDRCRFVLIGKIDAANDCYRELAAQVRGRKLEAKVVFAGWASEMERAYAAVDMIVVPSRHEDPAPNVNIEAMASGVPVIATRTGGSPELVLDGETGFLVDKEQPGQIVEKILLLAGDAALRRRMGQAGRGRARRLYDIRENAAIVENILVDA
jgi:spore coat protein SA